jgi:hypothetical protein
MVKKKPTCGGRFPFRYKDVREIFREFRVMAVTLENAE